MISFEADSLFESKDSEEQNGRIIRVAFEAGVDNEFDYLVPGKFWPIKIGQRVEVPFGRANKIQPGFCIAADIPADKSFAARGKFRRLKKVKSVIDPVPLIDDRLIALARWISEYYVCPLGQVLGAMLPAAVKKGIGIKIEKLVYLANDFQKQLEQVKSRKQKLLVSVLTEKQAFDSGSAVLLKSLLTKVGCTDAVLKKLAEKSIVKIARRETLPELPVIPEKMLIKTSLVTLNDDQQKAIEHITQMLSSKEFGVTVLYGVTDSGKTEVYIRAIEQALKKQKSAIVLLPEIALTAQTIQRFAVRFDKIAVMHSGLNSSQRNAQWHKIKNGSADVVIGARSAVFAPLSNLGLIIVDEEHEPGYKQDTVPRYHARDVAVKRAQLEGAHCILGSATPSLETVINCRTKKHFTMVRLPKRVMDLPPPQMKLIDLRQEISSKNEVNLISKALAEKLTVVLQKKEQAILLLNRRGYSNLVMCSSCKHTLHCRNCDVTLTFHKTKTQKKTQFQTVTGRHLNYGAAVCHHCGAKTLVPADCPLCSKPMIMIGLGTQRLEEELQKKFPDACIARVDSDSMAHSDYYSLLRDFSNGKIDILAGTQMLAKGLHFPNVTLVGIISADSCLYLPDFRANERTFQLISQVAGRAGRCEKKGFVYVQTFLPEQPAIKFALEGDFQGFITEELKHRKNCNLPPFWRLAVITLRDKNYERLETAASVYRRNIDSIISRNKLSAIVRGPVPAVINRIQRFHRIQIIVQAPKPVILQNLFSALRKLPKSGPAVAVAIDIDPVNLL